jgi:DNA-binding transcriptional LysR family regulator
MMSALERLDLGQVRLLAALFELGNLSAAARRVRLSQSAASHALARLRQHLGDPLFVRTGGGVHPTPYGERLGAAAYQALQVLAGGLTSDQPFDARSTTREFTLYLSDVGQVVLLPRVLDFLKKEAPGASVRVRSVPVENPGIALASGEVDLAVGFFNNLTTGFRQSLLGRERYVCVAREGHPALRSGMTLEAFVNAPHALADSSGMAHAAIDRALKKYKVRRHTKLVVPEFVVLPMIVVHSDLIVIMPARLAEMFAKQVPIQVFAPPVEFPSYSIKAYWHERYHHDATNRWFRRAFLNLFRDGPWVQDLESVRSLDSDFLPDVDPH